MIKQLVALITALTIASTPVLAQAGKTRLTGTVTAIEGDHIQIKDETGKPVLVMLQKTTRFVKSEKPATKADLKVGARIQLKVKMDEQMKMYAAEEVAIEVAASTKPAPPTTGQTKGR